LHIKLSFVYKTTGQNSSLFLGKFTRQEIWFERRIAWHKDH
jgi:hypothetical protein